MEKKAAVRLQWHDSMAQHGRLVASSTRTLHMLPLQQLSVCQDQGGVCVCVLGEGVNCGYNKYGGIGATYYCEITVSVSLSVLLTYSPFKVVTLRYILIYTCILHRNNLLFFSFWHILHNRTSWQLQLVLWHNED